MAQPARLVLIAVGEADEEGGVGLVVEKVAAEAEAEAEAVAPVRRVLVARKMVVRKRAVVTRRGQRPLLLLLLLLPSLCRHCPSLLRCLKRRKKRMG